MIQVEEAVRIIHSTLLTLRVVTVPIEQAIGRMLAEPVHADRDLPPYNRVAMDGIALRAEHVKNKGQVFAIEGVQAAGESQRVLKNPYGCIEVMTGAALPDQTTAVVRYEDIVVSGGSAKVMIDQVQAGMNVHAQGSDARQGQLLLTPGQRISPAEIAVLASVGKAHVRVFEFPSAAIVSTGDEIVSVSENPMPFQIRGSNAIAIQSAMKQLGWSSQRYHLPDNRDQIAMQLKEIMSTTEVLILSGGVSKGKLDYIPQALESLGIQKLFHQVSQRPGKPFFFGTTSDRARVVFALPGNPVSTFLCYYKYIQPWLLACCGYVSTPLFATLAEDVKFEHPLTYFLQVKIMNENGKLSAKPVPGGGSGDFANLKDVDGFLELPADQTVFQKGEVYELIPFRV